MNPLPTYAAALISIAITLVAFLTQLPDGNVSPVALVQLALLAASAIGVYLLPLLPGRWRAGLKTGLDVLAAILTAAVPFVIAGHITAMQLAIVVLAALKALGTEIGVQLRTSHALAA